MAGSFVLGVTVAVAHHLFYTALDGRVVQDQTEQQWYGRVGTGLAFLVKTLLVMAVSVACVQNVWRILKSKPIPLNGVDSMFDVLYNARSLSNIRLWFDGQAVVILATIAWLIPLAAVVVPPTLTVHIATKLRENVEVIRIPKVDFTTSNYGVRDMFRDWEGSQTDLSRIAFAVAAQGSVLNIAAPSPNASYTLDIFGPALRCVDADETVNQDLFKQAEEFSDQSGGKWLNYIAFVPREDGFSISAAINATLHATELNYGSDTLDTSSADMAKLYIGTVTDGKNATMHECGLYNSSYVVDYFRFNNSIQSLNVRNTSYLHGVSANTASTADSDSPNSDPISVACQSIMGSVRQILMGYSAFGYPGKVFEVGTRIRSTVLVKTNEFTTTNMEPFDNGISSPNNKTLSYAVEELVRNITLSLFSSPLYLQNDSSASPVEVTVRSPQNIYVYSPRNLVLAYGIAILFTLAGVTLGFWCMSVNRACYSNSFSTVLRATRNAQLDTLVRASETTGADPLPQHLARTKVSPQVLGTDGSGQLQVAIAVAQTSFSPSHGTTHDGQSSAALLETASGREAPRTSLSLDPADLDTSVEGPYVRMCENRLA